MDRLTDEERILAWKSAWHPSFDGIAIVNKDFSFRSVNPQFCKLLGVTPGELTGQKFTDITPPGIRELDQKNAEMLIKGDIPFYMLPKSYYFKDGRTVDVVLLVTRVPKELDKPFRFLVSRIMLDEEGAWHTNQLKDASHSPRSSPESMSMVVDFAMKYGKWFVGIGTILGAILVALFGKE